MGRGDTQEEREVEKWCMKEILLSFLASMLTTACAHTRSYVEKLVLLRHFQMELQ